MNATEAEVDTKALLSLFRSHLREHWLAGVVCDHEAKTDTASCSCSRWRDEPHPSVGAAVDAWIAHVFDTLGLSTLQVQTEAVAWQLRHRSHRGTDAGWDTYNSLPSFHDEADETGPWWDKRPLYTSPDLRKAQIDAGAQMIDPSGILGLSWEECRERARAVLTAALSRSPQ